METNVIYRFYEKSSDNSKLTPAPSWDLNLSYSVGDLFIGTTPNRKNDDINKNSNLAVGEKIELLSNTYGYPRTYKINDIEIHHIEERILVNSTPEIKKDIEIRIQVILAE